MKNPEELKKRDKLSLEDMIKAIQGKDINEDLPLSSKVKAHTKTDDLTSAVSAVDSNPITEARKNNSKKSSKELSKNDPVITVIKPGIELDNKSEIELGIHSEIVEDKSLLKNKVIPSSTHSGKETTRSKKPIKHVQILGDKTNIAINRDLCNIIRFEFKMPANHFIEQLIIKTIIKNRPEYKNKLHLQHSKKKTKN